MPAIVRFLLYDILSQKSLHSPYSFSIGIIPGVRGGDYAATTHDIHNFFEMKQLKPFRIDKQELEFDMRIYLSTGVKKFSSALSDLLPCGFPHLILYRYQPDHARRVSPVDAPQFPLCGWKHRPAPVS